MNILEIAQREMRYLFCRKSPAVLLLFGIPILYSLLFGGVYKNGILKYVPTVIYDQDQSATSRALSQAYMDSERYRIVAEVTTQEEMEQYLQQDKALVAVAIPPDFAKNIKLGLAAKVLIETNSTNNMFANAVISSNQEILQTFSAGVGQKLLEGVNQMPAAALGTVVPVKLGVRILHNPTTSYSDFMLAGLAANGLQIAILLVAGPLLAKEYKRLGHWQGTSSAAIVLGKLLPCWLCATGAFAALLAIVSGIFAVPFQGNPYAILLLGSAFAFLVTNISLFFSAVTGDETAALQVPLLYIMPGLLFSGLSWPHLAMNPFSRFFSALMPLTYLSDALRDLLLSGYSPDLLENLCILMVSGSGICVLTTLIFSKRRKQRQKNTTREVAL
jgi:ABC-2 type transport system permease protein